MNPVEEDDMSDSTKPDEPRRADDSLREANEQLTLKALQSQNQADASEQRWLEQRNLNDELVRKQRLLRVLASELTLTEQRERKRLATDLHDYLAQLMVLGRLKVGQARPKARSDATLVMLIDEINDIFSKSLSYTRTLMAELSPPVLQDLGFFAALQWMSEQLSKQFAITVDMQLPSEHVIVSEDQALFLY
jgi:signal transduction histidine kinase